MRRLCLPLILAAVATAVACHSATNPPGAADGPLEKLPRPLSADEQAVVQGSNDFAFNLFAAVDSAAGLDSNVFISPLSASMALGMTTVGAAGTTLDSMQSVLGYAGVSVDAMAGAYQSLIALLQSADTNVTFHIANAIWYASSISLLPTFSSTVSTDFNAHLQSADFTNPATAAVINQWVDSSTEGKIPKLLDNTLNPSTVAFLANAIYFYGHWAMAFDPSQTRDSTFTNGDGSSAIIPLMHAQITVPYVSTATYAAADLPYGRNAFRMTVILPAPGITLDSVIKVMRGGAWPGLSQSLDSEASAGSQLSLAIPKFQLTWGNSLDSALQSLGMGIAFDNGADFSNLAADGNQFVISEVVQQTYVDVDETGTTAAAATGVGIIPTAVRVSTPIPFSASHPFLYIIRERFSNAMLFVGAFTHPPAS